MQTLEVLVVGARIARKTAGLALDRSGGLAHIRSRRQPLYNVTRDLVLHSKRPTDLAAIGLRPSRPLTACVVNLDENPDSVARSPHAALDHGVDVKALSEFADIHRAAFELECGSARHNLYIGSPRQSMAQLIGQAIAETLVPFRDSAVLKRQHKDG
jgi:hypothetical protein